MAAIDARCRRIGTLISPISDGFFRRGVALLARDRQAQCVSLFSLLGVEQFARLVRAHLAGKALGIRPIVTPRTLAGLAVAGGGLTGRLLAGWLLAWRLLAWWLLAGWLLAWWLLAGRLLARRSLARWRLAAVRLLRRVLRRSLLRALGLILILRLILLLLQTLNLALHEVAIEFAVRIVGAQFQRSLVSLHGLGPSLHGLLGGALLSLLPGAVQRVAEVVVRVLLFGQARRVTRGRAADRFLKRLCRLRELPGPVRGRAGVELQHGFFGGALCLHGILTLRRDEIPLPIGFLCAHRRSAHRAHRHKRSQHYQEAQCSRTHQRRSRLGHWTLPPNADSAARADEL